MRPWLRGIVDIWSIHVATALVALRTNLMRSALTALGVMIGVFSVTLAVAVGAGAKLSVMESISSLGSNMALIFPEPNTGNSGRSTGDRGRVTERDAAAIERQIAGVNAVAPQLRTSVRLVSLGRSATTTVIGITPAYGTVSNIAAEQGRFIEDRDVRTATRVLVLGPTVAAKLFGGSNAVGREVRVNRVPFTVVGVLESKGSSFGQDNDDVALMPISTARQRLVATGAVAGPDELHALFVGFEEGIDLTEAKRRIRTLLRARNHVARGETEPFTIHTTEEFIRQTSEITLIFQALLVAIASISLLVGGIGIMNIMLVSVTERTREIGLRMAIGAKRGQIRNQFLVESAVLCVIGGGMGLALAVLAAEVFKRLADLSIPISAAAGAGAILFSAAVGLLFGAYPAWRASRLSPIEALRSE